MQLPSLDGRQVTWGNTRMQVVFPGTLEAQLSPPPRGLWCHISQPHHAMESALLCVSRGINGLSAQFPRGAHFPGMGGKKQLEGTCMFVEQVSDPQTLAFWVSVFVKTGDSIQ